MADETKWVEDDGRMLEVMKALRMPPDVPTTRAQMNDSISLLMGLVSQWVMCLSGCTEGNKEIQSRLVNAMYSAVVAEMKQIASEKALEN